MSRDHYRVGGTSDAEFSMDAGVSMGAGDSMGADDEYEYQPLRIDPSMSRSATATMLAVRAEFTGWELARSLRFTDGSRQVWLRRKRSSRMLPGLSL